jgi:CheY-like chemotaxis protein
MLWGRWGPNFISVAQTVSLPPKLDRSRCAKIITLALVEGPFDSLQTVSYKSQRVNFSLMAATILIADDYEDNRELLRLLLVAADYQVREAANGSECLAMAKEQPPDLIMMDLSMPILDGWGVFRALKTDERTAAIPCVAVTAYADSDRHRALQIGFSAYLSKPFRGGELLETVERLLADHKTNARAAETTSEQ